MDTIYEVEWLIDIGAGVLVLPPHTIWFPVFISILMECLLARLIKTKFWWLFNFQLSCRFNHNKQSRQHFIWKTLLSSKFVMNFCFNNHFYFQAQPEPGPPLLICPYPECLSSPLSPTNTPPSPPLPLPISRHHYPPQWSFIQKEELREQDWCSLEPEDHSLKRLSHTGSRVSKEEKKLF